MSKFNIKPRADMLGYKVYQFAIILRESNPNDSVLGKLTAARLSKAMGNEYYGSQADRYIINEADSLLTKMEAEKKARDEGVTLGGEI